jgi:hypothetical protein
MATASQRFPSAYMAAADLDGGPRTFTISHVTEELIGQDREEKLVVHFDDFDKGLVLNQTNWYGIANATGEEDDARWPGFKVTFRQEKVPYQGKYVPAVRVSPDQATKGSVARDHVADEDIPF